MAFYVFEFNIPANTPVTAPAILEKQVAAEVLKEMTVIIPGGSQGLSHMRVEDRERPIIPTLGSDPPWIRGDSNQITIRPNLVLPGPEWLLRFFGYNEDNLNPHTFIIHVDVQNK